MSERQWRSAANRPTRQRRPGGGQHIAFPPDGETVEDRAVQGKVNREEVKNGRPFPVSAGFGVRDRNSNQFESCSEIKKSSLTARVTLDFLVQVTGLEPA